MVDYVDPTSGAPSADTAPGQTPPAAPKQQAPDPYQIFQQRGEDIDAVTKQMQGLSAERRQLAFTPLPRTAPPNLQDIPQAPQPQMRGAFQELAPSLIGLMLMGIGAAKAPGMGALAAGTGYMEGFQAGDQLRMENERKNWENNMKAVVAQNKVATERYNAVLHNNAISQVERQAQLSAIAAETKDTLVLDQLKEGRIDQFYKLLEGRDKMIQRAEEFEQRQAAKNRELDIRKAELERKTTEGQQRHDARMEQISAYRERSDMRDQARRQTPGGLLAQEIQTRMDNKISQGMPREQAWTEANQEARSAAQIPPPSVTARLQDRADMVNNAQGYLDKAETLLNKHFGIAGIGGMVTRPMERVSNIAGISNATDRAQFERYISELKMWAPMIMMHRGGRPLAAEAAKIDRVIAGLNIGDTAANTKKQFQDLRELFRVINEQTRRQLPGGGQPAIPIPPAGTTPGPSKRTAPAAAVGERRTDKPWLDAPLASE